MVRLFTTAVETSKGGVWFEVSHEKDTPPAEYEAYVNDMNGVKVLALSSIASRQTGGIHREFVSAWPNYGKVVEKTRALTEEHFRSNIESPGPFKKAASLTVALIEHQPVMFKGATPEEMWDLAVDFAFEGAQLFIHNSFKTALEKKGVKDTKILPPDMPSKHFRHDLKNYVLEQTDKCVGGLSLIWEALTYHANKGMETDISGLLDRID